MSSEYKITAKHRAMFAELRREYPRCFRSGRQWRSEQSVDSQCDADFYAMKLDRVLTVSKY